MVLIMVTVLVGVIVRLGRTRCESGLAQCGQTQARPGSEKRGKTNLQEHFHVVKHFIAPLYVVLNIKFIVAIEHHDELLFASN
jgi:hypothetical protein